MANTVKIRFDQGANLPKTVGGNFFLTNSGGSVVNGTVRITVVDNGSFLDIVNATSSTYSQIIYAGGITELDVTTGGSDYPTVNNLFVDTSAAIEVDPTPAALTIAGQTPIVTLQFLTPAAATLTLTMQQPGAEVPLIPAPLSLTLSPQTPSVVIGTVLQPAALALTLTLKAPFIVPSPYRAELRIVGQVPIVIHTAFAARQVSHYWGKFQRGTSVNVMLETDLLPDDVPTVTIWNTLKAIVVDEPLPCLDETNFSFGYRQFLNDPFADDNYVAVIRFKIKGIQFAVANYFQVQGGSGEAPIISMLEISRPLGRAVVTQQASGDVNLGYKPRRKLT